MGRSGRRSRNGSGSRSRIGGRGSNRSRIRRRVGDGRRVTSLQDSGGDGSLSGNSQIHEYEEMT